MGNYTLQQAQNDIAALRGQIAHLLANADITTLEVTTLTIDGAITGPDTWHALTLANGWTGNALYQKLPFDGVRIWVSISSAAATDAQFATMPAGYVPATNAFLAAGADGNVSTALAPYVEVDTSGNVTMNGLHAFSTAGQWYCLGSYPLATV
jgi:hypothetical protein